MRQVLRESMILVAVGVAIGVATAYGAGRLLSTMLFGLAGAAAPSLIAHGAKSPRAVAQQLQREGLEPNTAAWTREVWGNPEEWGPTMRSWGGMYQDDVPGPSSRATLTRPIPAATLVKWRETDPRPANPVFFDGRPRPYQG